MTKALRIGALAVGIAASFVMAQAAEAGTLNLTRDPAAYTADIGGGEFGISNVTGGGGFRTATPPMKLPGFDFQSFCVEGGQDLSGSQPFTWTLETAVNGTGTALNSKVAYLYTIFWFGANGFTETGKSMLADGSGLDGSSASAQHTFNYNYTPGNLPGERTTYAKDLQEAIWWLMGQWQGAFSSLTANAREMVNLATISTSTGGLWNTFLGANSIGAVRILSLTSAAGVPQQDILVLLETGTPTTFMTPVPLPSSALMGLGLMAGIGAIGFIRRRRQTLS
jgi:hypothetical protein